MIAQVVFVSALLALSQAGHLGGELDEGLGDHEHATSYVGGHSVVAGGHKTVEYWAPPKYDFKYGVEDLHTGDWKQQDEKRDHDLTLSNYVVAEKDRKISVNRIISGAVPIPISKGW
ncbi:unnamed protein product [Psylliodes chrysocephalus]|uniref:Uncharacterized protein n=1 Tax=Psylliodes chrysocephalus TaxID=3402493 RepID=A0A9P0GD01_9CUCU|nr:unnamed protein product [Psylliodes chrysocephala]